MTGYGKILLDWYGWHGWVQCAVSCFCFFFVKSGDALDDKCLSTNSLERLTGGWPWWCLAAFRVSLLTPPLPPLPFLSIANPSRSALSSPTFALCKEFNTLEPFFGRLEVALAGAWIFERRFTNISAPEKKRSPPNMAFSKQTNSQRDDLYYNFVISDLSSFNFFLYWLTFTRFCN